MRIVKRFCLFEKSFSRIFLSVTIWSMHYSKADRIALAERRVLSVLKKRWLASKPQLQSKISEAGPMNQRCNPHILTNALNNLEASGAISKTRLLPKVDFYFLPNFFDPTIDKIQEAKMNLLLETYAEYHSFTQQQILCGDALERVIAESINRGGLYIPLGGAKSNPLREIGGIKLKGDLDFILDIQIQDSFYVLGEAKNVREWIYPKSRYLWEFIGKCLDLTAIKKPVLPVLIARKIHHLTFPFLKQIGLLGHQSHKQYLAPQNEDQLSKIANFRHVDVLGFFDITTNLEPPKEMDVFFSKTIPSEGLKAAELFKANAEILSDYVPRFISAGLGQADELYMKLSKDLRMPHDFEY